MRGTRSVYLIAMGVHLIAKDVHLIAKDVHLIARGFYLIMLMRVRNPLREKVNLILFGYGNIPEGRNIIT